MATDKIIDIDWSGSYEFYTAIPGSLIDKKYIDANNPLIQDSSFVEELKDLYKVLRNEIRREVYFGNNVESYAPPELLPTSTTTLESFCKTTTTIDSYQLNGAIPNIVTVNIETILKNVDGIVSEKKRIKLIPNFTNKTKAPLRHCEPVLIDSIFYKLIETKSVGYAIRHGGIDLNCSAELNEKSVIWKHSCGMIFDNFGTPIAAPICFNFDGISPSFDDEVYELERLLVYLKEHPWTVNKNDLAIMIMSDYPRYINAVIRPDSESFISIFNESMKTNNIHFFNEFCRRLCFRHSRYTQRTDWLGVSPFLLKR
jgi:hypothetical protein